jgi:hypothetical protein
MERGDKIRRAWVALAACALVGTIARPAYADTTATVPVNVTVQPMAIFEWLDPALLYLTVPVPSTTPPGTVRFRITGNASATITAIPDAFVFIPSDGSYMGKAVLDTSVLGYKIHLFFPSTGIGQQTASLPGTDGGGTPPLTVVLAGGSRQGEIRMDASQLWTPDGGMPALGLHVGQVILTLTADN